MSQVLAIITISGAFSVLILIAALMGAFDE